MTTSLSASISASRSTDIAVIGMSAWYPCGNTLKDFWTNVVARRRAFRRLPPRRLGADYQDPDPLAPDRTYLTRAAVIDGFTFDWAGRRIPKQVFDAADMVHWLALEVAIRAIEDAGYSRESLPRERSGVILGNTLTGEISRANGLRLRWPFVARTLRQTSSALGYPEAAIDELVAVAEDTFKSAFPVLSEDTLAGTIPNTIAGRICNYFDLKGGGFAVDGACASSLIAIAQAAEGLSSHRLDLALAGGVDVSIDPFETIGFAKIGALAREDMYVYEQRSQGFLPGEGCGWVVLKRLEDAHRDGDFVYAVLKGWGISSDGRGGLTAPTVDGQALAITRAYEIAGYTLADVDFVEGHGTGTAVGDATELKALSLSLESSDRTLGVTALKSVIGHTKAAAGVGSFIKSVIAVNQRVVPPLAGCERPHSVFDRSALFPEVAGRTMSADQRMRAGVSAFGFGGINVHATIESGDSPHQRITPDLDAQALFVSSQDSELFIFRADDFESLRAQVEPVAADAAQLSMAEMTDLGAHLARRATHGDCRAAVVASTPDELARKLEVLLNLLQAPPPTGKVQVDAQRQVWLAQHPEVCRVGFVFPGQGAQQLNMARMLMERFAWARDLVAEADVAVGPIHGRRLSEWFLRPVHTATTEELAIWQTELTRTEICQPAICLASVLYVGYLERLGVRPYVVGGHSLGELTAFWAAGALSLSQLFELAGTRGACMAAPAEHAGSMASLRCSADEAADLCRRAEGYVVVANINSSQQVVVSGDPAAVDNVLELARDRGIDGQKLPVSNAFHSRYVAAGSERLAREVRLPYIVPALHVRLFSGVDGAEIDPGDPLRGHFPHQMIAPVEFARLGEALSDEVDLLLEVGPGRVLSGLLSRSGRQVPCLPLEAQSGKQHHLNQALAAAFVYGAPLETGALFDRRYFAPYVSPADRAFIESPCEQDLLPPRRGTGEQQQWTPRATGAIARQAAAHLPAEMQVASPPTSVPALVELLTAAIVERTGFPRETVRPDMTFLNDLNLESIAAGEIVARAAQALGVAGRVDPGQLLQASIQQVAEALHGATLDSDGTPVVGAHPEQSELLTTLERLTGHSTWVRAFRVDETEAPLTAPVDMQLDGKRVTVVSDDAADSLAVCLVEAFASAGATATSLAFTNLDSDESPDLLVAVLPVGSDVRTRMQQLLSTAEHARASGGTLVYVERVDETSARAFAASLHHERPHLRVRVLACSSALKSAAVAHSVVQETLRDEPPFVHATYDAAGVRRVLRPVVLGRDSFTPRDTTWTQHDVVLATGGGRGITAELALAMAERTEATMVLMGRSTPDETEIVQTLARFQAAGRQARYFQCDITDPLQVESVLEAVIRDIGPISAVLHGAGANRPALVGAETIEAAYTAVAPKVQGLTNVLAALEQHKQTLRGVFGLSSIIGVTGMPGNAWYGFANAVLDRLLARYRVNHPDCAVASVAYSLWEGIGMGVKLGRVAEQVRRLGTSSIPVAEARSHFLRLLDSDPGTSHVVIAARLGGLDTWCPDRDLSVGLRFVENVATVQPGVELVVRPQVSLQRDTYLVDHCYKGTYLLPMVHGLEAMAQVVSTVLGGVRLDHVRIEDLDLPQPIVVDPEAGEELLVHAEVLESESDEAIRVSVGVASRRTGFARDHFSATFVLPIGESPAPHYPLARPGRALAIDPVADLYGRFLFHGPCFQRLRNFYVLRSDYSIFDAEEAPLNASDPSLLGDPFFRDSLLQAGQVVISQTRGLPRRIKRIDIFSPPRSPALRLVEGVLEERTSERVVCTLRVVDADGRLLQQLEGCEFTILEHLPDEPTAEEIAAPDDRDQRRLEQHVKRAAAAFGVKIPSLAVANLPDLQRLDTVDRHARERFVLERAVETWRTESPVGS
jgi:enediyne polyketide synthase